MNNPVYADYEVVMFTRKFTREIWKCLQMVYKIKYIKLKILLSSVAMRTAHPRRSPQQSVRTTEDSLCIKGEAMLSYRRN